MVKKKINRLNKEWYVCDEYGHTDKTLVAKVNEMIGIINQQQKVIDDFNMMVKNNNRLKMPYSIGVDLSQDNDFCSFGKGKVTK